MWHLDDHPLAEEIGNPDLFVGREKEMKRLLKWAEGTKPRNSKSMAILSRRKKGKTALLQRFYNVLYHRQDPRLIPFYYRIPENVQTKSDFTRTFYRRVLTQYFAYTTRTEKWVGTVLRMDALKDLAASDPEIAEDIRTMEETLELEPTAAWPFAQEVAARISQWKDVRILQILDEFQYLNKYIVSDHDSERVELLCHSYMGAAETKYAPQIVAGSYIGWLEAILGHLTSRYSEWYLEGLDDKDALAAVYNYASVFKVPITEATAPYVARTCDNDPFYIASTVSERIEEKDLTTEEGVRDALTLEVTAGKGAVAKMWGEYLSAAFPRLNGKDARRIVLYLAKHEPEERSRRQIREDLGLDMPENELAKKLHQLVEADILARGSSDFHFRGLGDRIFAMVFRRIYGAEIDDMSVAEIEDDFKKELATARGQIARYRGKAAEHRVRYRLLAASLRGATLADIVSGGALEGLVSLGGTRGEDTEVLGPFVSLRKAHFDLDQDHSVEIDIHAVHESKDGTDLMVEVKDWERPVSDDMARRFVEVQEKLTLEAAHRLKRRTTFLFYSESGLSQEAETTLAEAGVLILDPEKLARYEVPPPELL
jgi:hypothetical protein